MRSFILNKGLDKKQALAFIIICSTFIIDCINGISTNIDSSNGSSPMTLISDNVTSQSQKQKRIDELKALKNKLKTFGGKEHLNMFLTGAGGTGKSQVIYTSQAFCCQFAAKLGVMFNEKTFLITACTGSAASLLKGFTIHSCAHLNRKRLNDEFRDYWSEVRILIIDECSFLSSDDLKKLDKNLRLLRQKDVPFGGVNIIFAGDFHQLLPFNNKSLYDNRDSLLWRGQVKVVIRLETNHRFKDDPCFGLLLDRY